MMNQVAFSSAMLKNTDEGVEAFHFVLEHFNDLDVDHPKYDDLQMKCLRAAESTGMAEIAETDLDRFRTRVDSFSKLKHVGEVLGQAKNIYELARMIHLHVDKIALEKNYEQPGEISKKDILGRLLEVLKGTGIVGADGSPVDFGGVTTPERYKAVVAKLKFSGQPAKHQLPRDVGGFNMRQFVSSHRGEKGELWPQLVYVTNQILNKPEEADSFTVQAKGVDAEIKTITQGQVLDIIMRLPELGDEVLNMLPKEEEVIGDSEGAQKIKLVIGLCQDVVKNNDSH